MRPILLFPSFVALAFACTAYANDKVAHDGHWEDPTCKNVARAMIMTEIYPSYSYEMPLVRDNGAYRPFIERQITPTERREKRHFQKEWRSGPRLESGWSSWDRYEPVLTNCKLLATEADSTGEVDRYQLTWTNFPYRADMEAWISKEHQLLTRVTRRYLDDRWAFPEERVAFLFKYDDLPSVSPLRKAGASERRTSCERVSRMTASFNETQAIQVTIRFVNDGLGNSALMQFLLVGSK